MDGPQQTRFARRPVDAAEVTALAGGVHGVRRAGLEDQIEAVAEVDFLPVGVGDAAGFQALRRTYPTPVILHSATNQVGVAHVVVDVVELGQRQVLGEAPGLARVAADVEATVIAVDDELRVVGVNPERVVVGVDVVAVVGDLPERLAAIFGLTDVSEYVINRIRIIRRDV